MNTWIIKQYYVNSIKLWSVTARSYYFFRVSSTLKSKLMLFGKCCYIISFGVVTDSAETKYDGIFLI